MMLCDVVHRSRELRIMGFPLSCPLISWADVQGDVKNRIRPKKMGKIRSRYKVGHNSSKAREFNIEY